jgi:hypothetical protein
MVGHKSHVHRLQNTDRIEQTDLHWRQFLLLISHYIRESKNTCYLYGSPKIRAISMDAKSNHRVKVNQVTWTLCMLSLQTLKALSGDQLYRYYRYWVVTYYHNR